MTGLGSRRPRLVPVATVVETTLVILGRYGDYYGLEANATGAKYDVTPDGRRFLVARTIGQAKGEIVIWTGWLQGLKQQLTQARQ